MQVIDLAVRVEASPDESTARSVSGGPGLPAVLHLARMIRPFCSALLVLIVLPGWPHDAHANTSAGCAAPLSQQLPADPGLCLRQADVALPVSPAEPAFRALIEKAGERIEAGRFDTALRALACAEVVGGDDPSLRNELMRSHGNLEFRRERTPQALRHFECAAALAKARGVHKDEARDLNNVGVALRRLGDYQGALQALTRSLELKRTTGDVGGAVYNNLADVHRELEDPVSAMRLYGEALAAFRAKGMTLQAAHVLESMAEQALDIGDAARAETWLKEALATYRDQESRVGELRVHDGLTRAALARGDLAAARDWTRAALAIASERDLPLPLGLQLQIIRTERLSGAPDQAAARAREALAASAEHDPDRVGLWEELAAAQIDAGRHADANDSLRRARVEADAVSRAQRDRQLEWLRIRFETAERDRVIAALEQRNRIRTLQLWGVVVSVLALGLCAWLVLERGRQRRRLIAEASRVRWEQELDRYRREADALAEDRALLQTLLDTREEAACLLDADGIVLAANRAACRLIGEEGEALVGRPVSSCLEAIGEAGFDDVLERLEDSASCTIEAMSVHRTVLRARMTPWSGGSGRLVLELSEPDAPGPETASVQGEAGKARLEALGEVVDAPARDAEMRDAFRRDLVALMLGAVEAWESATASNRIELAEKSRIWRVNIDDGRLRARAMERYLSLAKLPRNPRWRDVLRTAYFVLGQCTTMREDVRIQLQAQVDAVLAYTRRDAMV